MELTYVGGHDAVEIRVPDWGPQPTVAHGESFDFPDAIAASLLEQPDNWARTQPELPLVDRIAKAKSHELDALAAEISVTFADDVTTVAQKKAVLAEAAASNTTSDSNDDDAGESGEEH